MQLAERLLDIDEPRLFRSHFTPRIHLFILSNRLLGEALLVSLCCDRSIKNAPNTICNAFE
jgi:hypothetical protein